MAYPEPDDPSPGRGLHAADPCGPSGLSLKYVQCNGADRAVAAHTTGGTERDTPMEPAGCATRLCVASLSQNSHTWSKCWPKQRCWRVCLMQFTRLRHVSSLHLLYVTRHWGECDREHAQEAMWCRQSMPATRKPLHDYVNAYR